MNLKHAVVQVLSADDSRKVIGTGFFCDPDGRVLTCDHVLKEGALGQDGMVQLRFGERELKAAFLLQESRPSDDIAVLKLPAIPVGAGWLRVAPLGPATLEHEVSSFGFPAGPFSRHGIPFSATIPSLTPTIVRNVPVVTLVGFNLDNVGGGFSGAPLIDDVTGHAVGMVAANQNDRQAFFVALTPLLYASGRLRWIAGAQERLSELTLVALALWGAVLGYVKRIEIERAELFVWLALFATASVFAVSPSLRGAVRRSWRNATHHLTASRGRAIGAHCFALVLSAFALTEATAIGICLHKRAQFHGHLERAAANLTVADVAATEIAYAFNRFPHRPEPHQLYNYGRITGRQGAPQAYARAFLAVAKPPHVTGDCGWIFCCACDVDPRFGDLYYQALMEDARTPEVLTAVADDRSVNGVLMQLYVRSELCASEQACEAVAGEMREQYKAGNSTRQPSPYYPVVIEHLLQWELRRCQDVDALLLMAHDVLSHYARPPAIRNRFSVSPTKMLLYAAFGRLSGSYPELRTDNLNKRADDLLQLCPAFWNRMRADYGKEAMSRKVADMLDTMDIKAVAIDQKTAVERYMELQKEWTWIRG